VRRFGRIVDNFYPQKTSRCNRDRLREGAQDRVRKLRTNVSRTTHGTKVLKLLSHLRRQRLALMYSIEKEPPM
jgi:hypothetical protein